MQATVSTFDPDTSAGTLLLDDGVRLPYSAEALRETGLRLLRPGQRVRLEVEGQGAELRVVALQIVTLA